MGKMQAKDKVHIYLREILMGEAFLHEIEKWLIEVEDERMRLLGRLLFEIEISEEEFHDTLYEYGSLLTEKIILEESFLKNLFYLCLRQQN